jgi:hypothetical protein
MGLACHWWDLPQVGMHLRYQPRKLLSASGQFDDPTQLRRISTLQKKKLTAAALCSTLSGHCCACRTIKDDGQNMQYACWTLPCFFVLL